MRSCRYFVATSAVTAFLGFPSALWAQGVAPDLGAAAPFAVLGLNSTPTPATVTCTDTGPGIAINGQVGTTAGGITNVGPCTITGPIVAPVAGGVVTAFNSAFSAIDIQNPVCTGVIPIVSTTLPPGVYCSPAGTTIGAGVTLTLTGNASDVWVFRVGTTGPGALTITGGSVVMGGAALACNVYWKTSAATTLTDAIFNGTVLSGSAVTMTRTNWVGRALARTDATLTDPIPMTFAGCALGAQPPGCPVTSVSPTVLANGSVGVAYSQTLTLLGGTGASTFTVPPGTLPPGLSLSSGGVLSGTPTVARPDTFTIRGTDTNGCFAFRTFTVTIIDGGTLPLPGCPVITLAPTVLPDGAVGVAYSQTITASGGTAPFTFRQVAGSVPAGLTLTTAGVLAGTPTQTLLPDSLTIRGTDSSGLGCFAEAVFTMGVVAGVPTLPQIFVLMLALTLIWLGYRRLQQRQSRYTD